MPEAQPRVVLAFDFGLRRIGIASGDTVSRSAAPHRAVTIAAGGIDWTPDRPRARGLQTPSAHCRQPLHADGTPAALSAAADRFAAALAQRSDLPVRRMRRIRLIARGRRGTQASPSQRTAPAARATR